MSNDKMREEFEAAYIAYCESIGAKPCTGFHMLSEIYVNEAVEMAWQMYQASRKSLVIELPEKCEFAEPGGDYHKGYRQGVREIVGIAEAAGLKVKK